MRLVLLGVLAGVGCATADPCPDLEEARPKLRDPAQVFGVFQDYVRCGEYGRAHDLLSADTKRRLPYPAFFAGLTAFDAPRRMLTEATVHAVEVPEGAASGRIRVCNPEFGFSRSLGVSKFLTIWVLDLAQEDLDAFQEQAVSWYRRQVRRADGWHFAYPPDWDYAPVARACLCGKDA